MPELLPVLVGLLGGVAGLALPRVLRQVQDGLAIGCVVTALALTATDLAPLAVAVGVAAVVFAVEMRPVLARPTIFAGVVLTTLALKAGSPTHLRLTVLVVALLAVGAMFRGRDAGPAWLPLALLAVSAVAIYGAVPDTEQITAVAVMIVIIAGGALTGLVAAPGPLQTSQLAAVLLVVWASGVGAAGRPASLAGATAALGFLWVAPLWRGGRIRVPHPVVLVLQVAIAVTAARTVGLWESTASAWPVAGGLVLATLVVGVVGRRTG